MVKKIKRHRRITFMLFVMITALALTSAVFSIFASGETTGVQGWDFNDKAKYSTNPIYMENHITEMPQTFEAYINQEEGGTSPIISSFPGKKNRDSIQFGIDYRGYPTLQVRQIVWIPEEAKYAQLQTVAIFTGESSKILGKGWTHIAITYEPGADASGTFILYINGIKTETITANPSADEVARVKNSSLGAVPALDIEYMQDGTREFSFGADGSTTGGSYFRGHINSAAMYSQILTDTEILSSYQNGVDADRDDIIAFYDYDMVGNNGTDFIKDQSGNGHDFEVAFYERESEPEDYAYSFAFVGDTQFTVKFEALDPTKNYASSIYDWIVQNKDAKNIKYVLGLGDITESHTTPELWPGEWELAVKLHEKLEVAEIPYAVIEGNHDGYNKNPATINEYFGNNKYFTDTITGYYKEGQIDSYYVNFEVGSHRYMIVALEHGADDNVLAWANEVVSANPDRRVIVITHALLGYDGDWTQDGKIGSNISLNDGIDTWNKFISLHENIIVAAAGHIDVDHIKYRTDIGVNGNEVKTFLINPQTLDEANVYETGMVAMFYFSEDGSDVRVEYISAYKTLEAQKSDPNAKDVLFGKTSQFSFKTQKDSLSDKAFALYSDGSLVATYDSYADLCRALENTEGDNYKILLCKNYDITESIAFPILNANVTFDLGGHMLIATNAINVSGGNLTLTFKNGAIAPANTVIGSADNAVGGASIIFEDVTFNFKTISSGAVVFDLDDANAAFNISVLGGKIESDISTLSSISFYTVDEGDSVVFGAYKNVFTKLLTHTTAFDYNHYAGAFPTAEGNRYFVEISDNGTESVYELQTLTVHGEDVSVTIDITGNVKYLSAVDYPFVSLASDGTLFGISNVMYGAKSAASAVGLAKDNLSKEKNKCAYILMRADYVLANTETYDITYINGTVIFDMMGYSITSPNTRSTHMIEPKLRSASYTTTIIFKNGAIKHGGSDSNKYVVCFSNNNNATGFAKTFNLEFDSVTFSLVDGATTKKLFHVGNYNGYNNGKEVYGNGTVNFTLTDCIFDLRNEPVNNFTVLDTNFGQSNAYIDSTVKINGGKIFANSLNKLTFTNFSCNAGDTVTFGEGKDGEYISLVLPKTADASKFLASNVKTENGKDISLILDTKSDVYTYKMYFATKYGNVPARYENSTKYPFIVFDNDGKFYQAAENMNYSGGATGAIAIVRNYLKANVWDAENKTYGDDARTATILMMRDVQMAAEDSYNNLFQLQGTVTIDLGGFILSSPQYKPAFYAVFNVWASSNDESVFDTEIIVKNGSIKNQNAGVVKFGTKAAGANKKYAFVFDNVDFIAAGPAKSPFIDYETQTYKVYASVDFIDCDFDINGSSAESLTLFNTGNTAFNVDVNVTGSSVTAGSKTFLLASAADGEGTLCFLKSSTTGYFKLNVASATSVPADKFNGGVLSFVKTGDNGTELTYTIAPITIVSYIPKMSITLDSNLVLNVYIPVIGTQRFTFDGDIYENHEILKSDTVIIGGAEYYHLKAELSAKEAARDVSLLVTVEFDGNNAEGNFTFSVLKYAKLIIDSESASETEKTLVKDILLYVNSAYIYFNKTAVPAIEDILGDYSSMPEIEGSAVAPSVGLLTASFVLDATPALKFYLPESADATDYEFKSSGRSLEFIVGSGMLNGKEATFIEISLYAFRMCETIEYSIDGVYMGSYHINAYYEYAKTLESDALVDLVESFWRYCQSARTYRVEVLAK